jgi:hypothetical protein
MVKKQPIFEKYNTKFNEEATVSGTKVFVNAVLFQKGKLDSADKREQVLTYQRAETILTKVLYVKILLN